MSVKHASYKHALNKALEFLAMYDANAVKHVQKMVRDMEKVAPIQPAKEKADV